MPSPTKKNSATAPMRQILTHSKNELFPFTQQLNHLKELTHILQEILDKELSSHCQVVGLEKNHLLIAVDNATWATRLRYAVPDLISNLKKQPSFQKIKSIECILVPDMQKEIQQSRTTNSLKISKKTKELLISTAQSIKDKGLKKALLRLADRCETAS